VASATWSITAPGGCRHLSPLTVAAACDTAAHPRVGVCTTSVIHKRTHSCPARPPGGTLAGMDDMDDDLDLIRHWDELDEFARGMVRSSQGRLWPTLAISFVGTQPDLLVEAPVFVAEEADAIVSGLVDFFGARCAPTASRCCGRVATSSMTAPCTGRCASTAPNALGTTAGRGVPACTPTRSTMRPARSSCTTRYEHTEGQLVLLGPGVELRFDAAEPAEDAPMTGTEWRLEQQVEHVNDVLLASRP